MKDIQSHITRVTSLVKLLDSKFSVSGHRFGLDPLIGLIPVIGDILPAAISAYIMWIGYHAGMPTVSLFRMAIYTALDVLIGEIAVIGDVFDFFYKSHTKNLDLLLKYLAQKNPSEPTRISKA